MVVDTESEDVAGNNFIELLDHAIDAEISFSKRNKNFLTQGLYFMKIKRRQALVVSASALVGACVTGRVGGSIAADGVGPNRGVRDKGFRGKQTCDNTGVPVSDIANRLATPEDFSGDVCQLDKDSHEGPYFTCAPAPGKAIAGDQAGQALTVAMRLLNQDCQPIPGGVVDIWSCNATGHYSGHSTDPDERPPMVKAILFGHIKPDESTRFCRGALITDDDGIAEFETIYPGFYYGVPIHMHMKAHVDGKNLLTTQANFPEEVNQRIMQTSPYADPRPIQRSSDSTGFPVMRVQERGDRLLATLDLIVPT